MLPQEIVFPRPAIEVRNRRVPRPIRLLARLRAGGLDRRLLEGEDPAGSELLAARAAQLTADRHRDRLAASLDGLLRVARRPRHLAAISPDASALLANEEALRDLAARLEGRHAVYARGVARVERLLTDSESEVYRGGVTALAERLAAAAAELDGAAGPIPPEHGSPSIPMRRVRRETARSHQKLGGPPRARAGGSSALPDGPWLHGRRESS